VNIRWYGQSAFLLEDGHRVAVDPFGDMRERAASRGFAFDYPPMEGLHADLLLITHEHGDHNAAEAVRAPAVIRSTAGTLESPIGNVVAIASEHDDVAGTARGPNTIFRFELGGLRLCHFGDFGQDELRSAQRDAIGDIDVLFLPVGGGPTVGGEAAAAIVRELRPALVVPMHYRTEAVSFLDPPDAFLEALGADVARPGSSSFDAGAVLGSPGEPTVVVPAAPTAA
jgi:L-ascorbate metabolism protein UlaG (beta-lactamase superfamily)